MSQLMLTLILAFVFIALAIAALAIGWLITGKAKISAGSCGRNPEEQRKEECGSSVSCSLCHTNEEKKQEDDSLPEEPTGND